MGYLQEKSKSIGGGGGGGVVGTILGAGAGSGVGGAILGPVGGIYGAQMGAGAGGGDYWESRNPLTAGSRNAKKAEEANNANAAAYFQNKQPINQALDKADTKYYDEYMKYRDNYLDRQGKYVGDFTAQLGQLSQQAADQAKNAKATYSNTIQPNAKSALEQARANASQAMSLSEAGDPNNKVQQAVRALYEQEGQKARTRGQQDFGVLSGLGAQAAAGQFGSAGPMTSGMMGQIYGANQQQAGDAYARAQQRMHDLQQQGIDRGFDQSNFMYQAGQDAQDRWSQRQKDLSDLQGANIAQLGGLRNEQGYYGDAMLGAKSGLAGDIFTTGLQGNEIQKGNAYAGGGRISDDLAAIFGMQTQGVNNRFAGQQADTKNTVDILGSLIGGGSRIAAAQ